MILLVYFGIIVQCGILKMNEAHVVTIDENQTVSRIFVFWALTDKLRNIIGLFMADCLTRNLGQSMIHEM